MQLTPRCRARQSFVLWSGFYLPAIIAVATCIPISLAGQSPAALPSPVLGAMSAELQRSMRTLGSQPTPPFFLSYTITETHSIRVRGSFGALTASDDARRRLLNLDVRVGTPAFDNTHAMRGTMRMWAGGGPFSATAMPIEDDPAAIRRILWYATDRAYKRAAEQLIRAKADTKVRVAAGDTSPDFSREPAERFLERPAEVSVNRPEWERKVRTYTAPFAKNPGIYDGEAELSVEGESQWYVDSDGSRLQTSSAHYRLVITAYTKAANGMTLPRYESVVTSSPDRLPSDSTVLAMVAKMVADLEALRKAPLIEAATAPAILSGRASGVFFHEVFGHRVEGHRQKNEEDAQTFKGKIGERILPAGFSVYSDPTLRELGGAELAGHYEYDDQGVKARRVNVVKNGIFRNFLMSRSPIAGFAHSNGHGRRESGFAAVARQSNLIVAAAQPVSHDELRRLLVAQIRQQHKPWGLIFDDIEGGFTITQRFAPNAFNVMPVMVYRVFPDGREELVRGVDFIGTPLTAFGKIIAADDRTQVFNGICGAESGSVPVSASSPAILLSEIEVQRKEKSQNQAPILPPPAGGR